MTPSPLEGVRVLVLGDGARARRARVLLAEQGAYLVGGFDSSVTYVVVDRGVSPDASAVVAAHDHAVPVLTTSELREWPGMESLADAVGSRSARRGPRVPVPFPARSFAYPPRRRSGPSVGWTLACVLSLGFATPGVVGHAAHLLKSRTAAIAAGAYGLGLLALCLSAFSGEVNAFAAVGVFGWLSAWIGGSVHAYLLGEQVGEKKQRELGEPFPAHATSVTAAKDMANAAALAEVAHQGRLRREARKLLDDDPVTARALRIGRPDLPRTYDDGGLVDVNHAPIETLRSLPGVTLEIAEQIIEYRQTSGSFESVAEIVVHTGIDPRMVDEFQEMALFLA
ncbi:MAG: ComEA family DNA-binding protein [Stackebrandtia sp.]